MSSTNFQQPSQGVNLVGEANTNAEVNKSAYNKSSTPISAPVATAVPPVGEELYPSRKRLQKLMFGFGIITLVQFIVFYTVWWYGILMLAMTGVGIFATLTPSGAKRLTWVKALYYMTFAGMGLEVIMIVVWIFRAFGSVFSGWDFFVAIFGIIVALVFAFLFYTIMNVAKEFWGELETTVPEEQV